MARGLDSIDDLSGLAKTLAVDGFGFVARYLFNGVSHVKKILTAAEAHAYAAEGVYTVTIWESGYPIKASYFHGSAGQVDAIHAQAAAKLVGQPAGSAVYFAVDGDVDPSDVESYFRQIRNNPNFTEGHYLVGAYGSGAVLAHLKKLGLIDKAWLAQSTGWRGYTSFVPHADIIQHGVGKDKYHGHSVDFDTSNGNAGGWMPAK